MSAELLRRAAALMRERAEAATPGGPRWETGPDEMHGPSQSVVFPADSDSAVAFAGSGDAEHIASWHPAVALAVADLLDLTAEDYAPYWYESYAAPFVPVIEKAYQVAHAYLGEQS